MFVLTADPTIRVEQAPLACCSLEFDAAVVQGLLTESEVDGTRLNVLVVSGTITRGNAGDLVAQFDAMPEPKKIVAFGACASSGGPYEGGYSIINGAAELIPVDVYVPGCPPSPPALEAAIREVAR